MHAVRYLLCVGYNGCRLFVYNLVIVMTSSDPRCQQGIKPPVRGFSGQQVTKGPKARVESSPLRSDKGRGAMHGVPPGSRAESRPPYSACNNFNGQNGFSDT